METVLGRSSRTCANSGVEATIEAFGRRLKKEECVKESETEATVVAEETDKVKDETARIAYEVCRERVRQDERWGIQRHGPDRWMTILVEEVGEAAQASLDRKWEAYRNELIQTAAVAIAAIECLDEFKKGGKLR
jgi:NTP pyrophosphatase (non-canonical NTP hydrolase)